MKELLQTLGSIPFKPKDELEEAFTQLANTLLNEYVIEKTFGTEKTLYELTEIEFYLRKKDLNDTCVHRYEKSDAGGLRVHYSGIDLTFGSSITHENIRAQFTGAEYYGGILIRGLWNETIKENNEPNGYICGPLRCQCELLSGLSIGNSNLSITFKKRESKLQKELAWTKRKGVSGKYSESLLCCFDTALRKAENTKGYDAAKRFKENDSDRCIIRSASK